MFAIEAGRIIGGKYRLERPLARGGMGSIWIGRHLQLDVGVAVKFMDPSFAAYPELRARFEREAKACAQMKSPHVVQVHDYGIEADTAYIVMELLEGEDLAARLTRLGRLSLPATAAILAQVCRGLRRAHEAGIVHRDLKPGNIFLTRHDDEDLVKVLDFGIAKATGPGASGTATSTGAIMGSPFYMSPEQIRRAKEVDHRSDLWAVGVILFECLTGTLPFEGREVGDILVAICTEPVPPPSRVAPFLSLDVDRFFERALARDPAQRFQSAREMAEAFGQLAGRTMSGPDWSQFRPSDPPPEPRGPSLPSQPSAARASTEILRTNSTVLGGASAPAQTVSPTLQGASFAPAGQSATSPGRRGAPAAAVAVAAIGTLILIVLGGVFVARRITSGPETSAAGPATAAPVAEEKPSAPASASAPAPIAVEAPPIASAAPPTSATSAAPPALAAPPATGSSIAQPALSTSASGRRAAPAPTPTSGVFGF